MKKSIISAFLLLLCAVVAHAQDITVKGSVWGLADDEPLIGASVIPADNPNRGVTTDIDGNFTITVARGTQLTISYVGYVKKTVEAAPELKVVLSEDAQSLNEVVVVGYTTVRKADLTGAVSVMDMKKPLSENSGNILNSMAGKLPGVEVIPDAAPGGTGNIRVRGMSTANSSNDPLYIVDGIPTDNISDINPGDIESMQVLKDAASASIYGSRAANGVVIITTKQGKGDRLAINVNYAASAQTIAKRYEVLDAYQWGDAYWQAYKNSNNGATPSHSLYGDGPTPVLQKLCTVNGVLDPNFPTANTDWQDEIYHTAWTNNLTASVSNSSDRGSVFFSMNYINQNSTIESAYFRRYSARVNSNFSFNKYITIGENLTIARSSKRGIDVAGDRGIAFAGIASHPAMPVRGLNGAWANSMKIVGTDLANPAHVIANNADNDDTSWRILGNAYLQVNPIDGLAIKTNFGLEHSQYFTVGRTLPVNEGDIPSVTSTYGQGDTWTWTNTINYVKTFGKNNINLLFGTEAIGYTYKNLDGTRSGYPFLDPSFMQLGAGETILAAGGGKSQWAVFSIFGKADYNFDDRYLASFTIRRDANSRFAKEQRNGVFPAFSLAWRPTQEAFFPENDYLNDLKIRYSWGQNGNANIPPLYPVYSEYKFSTTDGAYDMDGSGANTTTGITRLTNGNPQLKWETTTQNNIGVDFQLFNGSMNLSADYYIKKTKDMLTEPPVLAVAGEHATMWMNTGDMKNTGWEIQLGYNSPLYGDFSWSGSINISQYKNTVVKLNNQQTMIGNNPQRLIEGEPMGVYYGFVCDGIFQNNTEVANHARQEGAAPGRLIFRDLDGNGVIDDNDRCIIGDPNADLSLGLNLTARYRDFTLDMFFAGDFGFDIQNLMKRQLLLMSNSNLNTNRGVDVLNAWTPDNTDTDIPALALSDNNNEQRFSSWYVQDGSYMKMKYLKLSYNLPKQLTSKFACRDLSVYFQVENVFTITKYKGLDPEINLAEYGSRIDSGAYPRPRTFTMGINLAF